ncbi:preprotein translocase subunit SecE [Coxiella endosymbiont of Amblyomma nuttalli]|uniref:preprotein translocase subunit SecE n=1 Tax=Coxiella endosymbiont of Amblyomma nuttalli TaxID=2749996 RepID=UPI001BA4B129|nr:preprotein translocase subunit SecE [Coxiella endosymbiont of Amblyomma nuttalli]QTS83778.1 Protein translocase subunit SecE [Coxiella endosymbiont of Amblyomma nuttalli]
MAQQSGTSEKKTRFEGLKCLLVVLLLAGAVVPDFFYRRVVWPIRVTISIVMITMTLAIVLRTRNGQRVWEFIKGARTELRKVSWPTRLETVQTTLGVIIVVMITALILWAIDSSFMWVIAWMTGQ